jgi:DNA-binding transcriptional regulator YhcF (GntR family)
VQENNFVQIYREALTDPAINEMPLTYRWVYLTILINACHSPCTFNDHGITINLKPGQFMCTIRKLAELANVKPNHVQRALAKLSHMQKVIQEVIHKKTILTVVWGLKLNNGDTRNDAKVIQERYTKEESKKVKHDEDDDAEKFLEDEKLKTQITKQDKDGFDILCKLDDYFEYAVRKNKPWSTEEIQAAWETLVDYPSRITHWKLFMDGAIKKERDKKLQKPKEKKKKTC